MGARPSSFRVSFERIAFGELRVELEAEDSKLVLMPSAFMRDHLAELVDTLLRILDGHAHTTVQFYEEPGEVELRFTQTARGATHLIALLHRDHRRGVRSPDHVFEASEPTQQMLLSFWRALRRLESIEPADVGRWPFPRGAVAELGRRLRRAGAK